MSQHPFKGIIEAEQAAGITIRKREIESLFGVPTGTAIPNRDLYETNCDGSFEGLSETGLAVDDRLYVLIDDRREREAIGEIANADIGPNDLCAQNDHVLEGGRRQLEVREETRNVVGLEIDRLVGRRLVQNSPDEAFGDLMAQASRTCTNMNPASRWGVNDHCLARRSKVDSRTVAKFVDLPHTGRRIWMEKQIHLSRRFIAIGRDIEPVNVVAIAPVELFAQLLQQFVEHGASRMRANFLGRFHHEGLVVLVVAPVEPQMQAVLCRLEQGVFTCEGP